MSFLASFIEECYLSLKKGRFSILTNKEQPRFDLKADEANILQNITGHLSAIYILSFNFVIDIHYNDNTSK